MSRARTLIFGLLALVALLVALVGVPAALVILGGNLLPDHVPGLQEIWTAVSTADASGALFMGLLTIVGWIGWASFAISTMVEGWAALTRVQVPALRGPMSLTQGSSAALVGAIVAAVAILGVTSSTPAAAASSTSQHTATTATAQTSRVASHAVEDAGKTTPHAPTTDTRSESVTVTEGDTLWQIAQDELGDGSRYDELADASDERVQPDGQRLTDPDLIHPGWTINLPGEDTDSAAQPREQAVHSQ
ncbi:MAG: LysM peptidoglycan-binding domain-containing protein, partial [Nocardioidaceae bacterium]|nr:LysM peptidoglycan-binding domain-containing protein [Nocardioidaceae bacterium]